MMFIIIIIIIQDIIIHDWGAEVHHHSGLADVWTTIVECFCARAHSKLVEAFFWRSPNFGLKNRLNFGADLFFRQSPKLGQKTRLNFGEDLLFWDHLILTEKPPQSNSKLMFKFVYCSFKLSKNPPPLRNSGYAPALYKAHYAVLCLLCRSFCPRSHLWSWFLLVMAERMRLRVQAYEMRFLQRIKRVSLFKRMHSSEI